MYIQFFKQMYSQVAQNLKTNRYAENSISDYNKKIKQKFKMFFKSKLFLCIQNSN